MRFHDNGNSVNLSSDTGKGGVFIRIVSWFIKKPPLPISELKLTLLPDDFHRVHYHIQCNASIQIN